MLNNNPYELLYMSRLKDRYAFEALFTQTRGILYNVVSQSIDSYKPLAPHKEDILQEASISIWRAIETYREDKDASFYTFFLLLARRKVWNICKHYSRKVIPLSEMTSLDEMVMEGDSLYEAVAQKDPMNDPVYAMNYRMAEERLDALKKDMSETETDALDAWERGESYRDGAEKRGLSCKTWDGRRFRVRRKVRKAVLKD